MRESLHPCWRQELWNLRANLKKSTKLSVNQNKHSFYFKGLSVCWNRKTTFKGRIWGLYIGGNIGNLKTIPFCEFQFHLVSLIPYSAIAKTILIRSLIFHILPCEKSIFKTTISVKKKYKDDMKLIQLFCWFPLCCLCIIYKLRSILQGKIQ